MFFVNNVDFNDNFVVKTRIILKNEFETNLSKSKKNNIVNSYFYIIIIEIIDRVFQNRCFEKKHLILIFFVNQKFIFKTKIAYNIKRFVYKRHVLIKINSCKIKKNIINTKFLRVYEQCNNASYNVINVL